MHPLTNRLTPLDDLKVIQLLRLLVLSDIAREALAAISEQNPQPQQVAALETLLDNPTPRRFNRDTTVLSFVAAIFLLQTYVKIKRNNEGKREFLIKKPSKNSLLDALMRKSEHC